MSNGKVSVFFTRPLSLVFVIISILSILYPFLQTAARNLKKRKTSQGA